MLRYRKELHEINPFYIWHDEEGYHTGIWYWKMKDREKFYEELDAKMSGPTGDLVALLPETAMFRTDPHREGAFAAWYHPDYDETDWVPIQTTRPFYVQGYQDEQGYPYVGNIWYRLKVDVPAEAQGKKIRLAIPLVQTEAWCWVNGQYIGHRPFMEAYFRPASMEVDVTAAIRPGETNVIAIRADTSLAPAQAAEGLMSRLFLYSPQGTDE